MKNKLLTMLLLLAIFAGCSKENLNNQVVEEENVIEVKQLIQSNLDLLTIGILGVSDISEFRGIVIGQANKAFDGDYNALVSDVIEICNTENFDLRSEMNNYFKNNSVNAEFDELITFFAAMKIYPHIYIPCLENQNVDVNGLKSVKNSPYFVTDNVESDKYSEFVSVSKSQLKSGRMINEKFAFENEVWVIAINERVDKEGNVKSGINTDMNFDSENPPIVLNKSYDGRQVILNGLYCPDISRIEGWTRGGPELWLQISSQKYKIMPYSGAKFGYHCSRSAIHLTWLTVNQYLGTWNYSEYGEFLYMWFFEEDEGVWDYHYPHKYVYYGGQNYQFKFKWWDLGDEAGGREVLPSNYGGEFWGDPDNIRWRFIY